MAVPPPRKTDPLAGTSIPKNLSDKLYERRKLGALEIEQLVKDYAKSGIVDNPKIVELIHSLRVDFVESTSVNARKGGLIAMAAIALGLKEQVETYVTMIIPPVIVCFNDPDHKVRYFALESLYNITKVARGRSLTFFNEIFDSLCKMAADPDRSVRDGAEFFDRLIRDIVTEGHSFDVEKFIPLLSERVHITTTECRRFLVGWIRTLASVPDVELLEYLPHFLDGLFKMLSDKSEDIRVSVKSCLSFFLEEIKNAASAWEELREEQKKLQQNIQQKLDSSSKDQLEGSGEASDVASSPNTEDDRRDDASVKNKEDENQSTTTTTTSTDTTTITTSPSGGSASSTETNQDQQYEGFPERLPLVPLRESLKQVQPTFVRPDDTNEDKTAEQKQDDQQPLDQQPEEQQPEEQHTEDPLVESPSDSTKIDEQKSDDPTKKLLDIVSLLRDTEKGVPLEDRKWLYVSYKNTFLGSQLITCLQTNKVVETEQEATSIGDTLLQEKYINCASKVPTFKPDEIYQFSEQISNKTSAQSLSSSSSTSSSIQPVSAPSSPKKTLKQKTKKSDSLSSLMGITGGTKLTPPRIHYGSIIKILIPHCESTDDETSTSALTWLLDIVSIGREALLPYSARMLYGILPQVSHVNRNIEKVARKANSALQSLIKQTSLPFPVKDIVDAIIHQFSSSMVPTKHYALRWILILHVKTPSKLLQLLGHLFPSLLHLLSDPAEEVVRLDLQVLARLSTNEAYFQKLMHSLVQEFCSHRKLLEGRGTLIIRQLCLYIPAEQIYRTLSELLEAHEDTEFASLMVQILNLILLTASELVDVRNSLRSLSTKESVELFTVLYRSWCHNEAAVFSLCLLTQVYEHASHLIFKFADFEMTVNTLIEIDKLVQLLESPIFMYLRLQLLEPEKYPFLFKSLYGLLMLLPQSQAFNTLRKRLNCVTSGVLQVIPKPETQKQLPEGVNFEELLDHFVKFRSRHHEQIIKVRLETERRLNNVKYHPSTPAPTEKKESTS
eukprot:TRINITY_DN1747_c0_g1_i1.p1 TRINITY_DN1747_c0_g1~~TRINITY_DN1747_c0_g1_i1.p1  ORF type:complete len:1009 (+),score=224.85 TRINITY_DN1747_c0_g1_i1:1091-4117(+)